MSLSHIVYASTPQELQHAIDRSVEEENIVVRCTTPTMTFSGNHRLNIPRASQGLTVEGPVTLHAVQLWMNRVKVPVLFRNVRFRVGARHLGKGDAMDAAYLEKCSDVTFENCSFSHASDELVSINYCAHVRFIRCIFSNPLHIPTVGGLGDEFIHPEGAKGSHGYGLRSSAVLDLSLEKCVFANCHRRSPQCNNKKVRANTTYKMHVNDTIIYNYGQHGFTYNNKPDEEEVGARYMVHFHNNWFIPGPRTRDTAIEIDCEEPSQMQFRIYGLSSCAVSRKRKMDLKFKSQRFQIDSGEGLSESYSHFSQRAGALPHDDNDASVLQEIAESIHTPSQYDNLDEDSYHLRWPESGWVNFA